MPSWTKSLCEFKKKLTFAHHFLVESTPPNSSDFNRPLDGNRANVDGSWLRMAQNNSSDSEGGLKQPMEDGYV